MTDLQRITVEYDCERITIENVQNKKIVFYFLCGNRYYIGKMLLCICKVSRYDRFCKIR